METSVNTAFRLLGRRGIFTKTITSQEIAEVEFLLLEEVTGK
jgi:hypothetical protein